MKVLRKFLVVSCGLLGMAISPNAAGAQCDSANAISTTVAQNFFQQVKQEYGRGSMASGRAQSLAMGHALGRAGRAVQGNPAREVEYACIDQSMKQIENQMHSRGMTDFNYLLLQEAASGYHDNEVYRLTGVSNKSPLANTFSISAGPMVGGGVNIQIREGSRPKNDGTMRGSIFGIGPSAEVVPPPSIADPNGPNFNDLPNSETRDPETGHFRIGYMMRPPKGIEDKSNWIREGQYKLCVTNAREAERGKNYWEGGLGKGTILVLAYARDKHLRKNKPDQYHCFYSAAPFENVYMDEMEKRKVKMLKQCRTQLQSIVKWCEAWYMN